MWYIFLGRRKSERIQKRCGLSKYKNTIDTPVIIDDVVENPVVENPVVENAVVENPVVVASLDYMLAGSGDVHNGVEDNVVNEGTNSFFIEIVIWITFLYIFFVSGLWKYNYMFFVLYCFAADVPDNFLSTVVADIDNLVSPPTSPLIEPDSSHVQGMYFCVVFKIWG